VYDIRVKLKDDSGAESEWSEMFTILIDGTPPTVQIIKPQKGFLYFGGSPIGRIRIFFTTVVIGSITVVVSAVDENGSGMSHVEFYLDNVLQHSDDTGENGTYSWLWHEHEYLPLFPYELGVTAFDGVNNSASLSLRVWKLF
jgi:hypothetical protein